MFKISENIRLYDGKSIYDGNYYGEQTVDSTGQSMPHGRGVWVGNDGWIWVQWFENGIPINDGKFIWINTKETNKQIIPVKVANIRYELNT